MWLMCLIAELRVVCTRTLSYVINGLLAQTGYVATGVGGVELWSNKAFSWCWGWNGCEYFNWHNTHSSRPRHFFTPSTFTELKRILCWTRQMRLKVKVVGSSCSPNSIASCNDVLVSLIHFNNITPHVVACHAAPPAPPLQPRQPQQPQQPPPSPQQPPPPSPQQPQQPQQP
eukprot:GHVS01093733.1.p1 GENE.GHVS01093733.1~~GHVS01093733.1.p1  ORF type:complete len:172 (+),score=43.30 GHVS01093733.1:339-854(+)